MRGETVTEGVRAHLAVQSDRPRVALDDLVEPLPGQRTTAKIEEESRLFAPVQQFRTAAAQVAADRCDRLPAERHDPFLRALAAGADEALVQIDVAHLEPDHLRGP